MSLSNQCNVHIVSWLGHNDRTERKEFSPHKENNDNICDVSYGLINKLSFPECDIHETTTLGSKWERDSGIEEEQNDAVFTANDTEKTKDTKRYCVVQTDVVFWRKVIIIFSALDVLLLITVFTIIFCVKEKGQVSNHGNHCFSCRDVLLTTDGNIDNVTGLTRVGNSCCSNNITLLAQKYVSKRYSEETAALVFTPPPKTAAHLLLDEENHEIGNSKEDQVLTWKSKGSSLSGNLTLSSNITLITGFREGIYSVMSHVVYDVSSSTDKTTNQIPLRHQLVRRRNSLDRVLVDNLDSRCAGSTGSCKIPSTLHRAVLLNDGDAIFIRLVKPIGFKLSSGIGRVDVYMI